MRELERELRLLKLEDELAKLRSSKSGSREKEAVLVPVQDEPEGVVESRFRLQMPAGLNNLGTFNGKSDLETFLSRFFLKIVQSISVGMKKTSFFSLRIL